MTGARERWRPWLVALALAAVTAAANASMHRLDVCGPVDDETLLLPIAMRTTGLASFAGDRWLAATGPVFSIPYSWIVGTLLRVVDDPLVALRWLALPFQVVFLVGSWRVAERFAGRNAAWAAMVLLAASPPGAAVLPPGAGLPRDLVFALVPWFVLGAESTRERPRAALVLFFALGLVANLHPLTALHAAIWLGALEIVREPSMRGVGAAALRALAFAAGAAPYVVQYLARPAAPGAVDEAVYAWRLGSMGGETVGVWTLRMEALLWLAAGAAIAALAARRSGTSFPRWLVAGAVLAFVLAAAGPTIGRFLPPLRGFQLARFERIAAWCAVLLLAAGIDGAMRARRFAALGAAAACVLAAVLGPVVLGGTPPRGPIARAGRALDRRTGIPPDPPPPPQLVRRAGVADPASPPLRDAFLAVCRHARVASPQDALFLVPPEHWGAFRVYARRGAAVTRKEGGAALSFLGAAGMDWFRDYAEAVRVYATGDAAAWEALARRTEAAFAVTDAATAAPPGWTVVFEAPPFRVLAVPAK